jgi:probable rRNA maturation factor
MIEVNNLTTSQINKQFLKKIVKKVLQGEKKKIELSIALVNQTTIKKLNKKYRNKDKSTDILSFFYGDSAELVICPVEVKKNALIFKNSFKKELAKTLIHGILHLTGYDHEATKKKAETMEKRQEYYLSQF